MRHKIVLISMQIGLLFALSFNAKVALSFEPYIGEVRWFAGSFAPRGWAKCDGQLLPINQYQAMFSILGTQYGGDGRTTFALPDMRGRSMLHAGTGPGLTNQKIGSKSGSETVVLNSTQLPNHSHALRADSSGGDSVLPNDRVISKAGRLRVFADNAEGTNGINMGASSISDMGASQAHNNMQPYVTATCIIAVQGLFPSRN